MAARTLSRRALRDQHDQVEAVDRAEADEETMPEASEPAEPKVKKPRAKKAAGDKPAKIKAPAKPRVSKKAAKVPARMVARWAVCDGAFKRIAIFDYKDRAGADAKLVQLREEKKGPFFMQMVKDPYDPPPAEPVSAV